MCAGGHVKLVSPNDKNGVLQKLPAQFAGTVYIQANRPPWFGMRPIGSLADNPAKPCAQLLDPVAEGDIGPGVSLRTPCLAGGRESRYEDEARVEITRLSSFLLGGKVGVEFDEPDEFVAEKSTGLRRPLANWNILYAAVIPASKMVQAASKFNDRGFCIRK